MTTFTVPEVGITIHDGSVPRIDVGNTGTVPVMITGMSNPLNPGFSVRVPTGGAAVTCYAVGGTGTVEVMSAGVAAPDRPSQVDEGDLDDDLAVRVWPDLTGDFIADLEAGTTRVVAHRGAGKIRPEHSMEAYRACIAQGIPIEVSAHYVTGGVTPTSLNAPIGVIVCMHDATLDRTTDAAGNLADLTAEAIRNSVKIDIGASINGAGWSDTYRIPVLDDVLQAAWGKVPIILEFKTASSYAVNAFAALLRRYSHPGRNVILKHYSSTGAVSGYVQDMFDEFGIRPWMYLDTDPADGVIAAAAASVRALGGLIGLPNGSTNAKFTTAAATGVPVMAWEVERRYRMGQLETLGVRGMMSPQADYLLADRALLAADQWKWGVRSPGEVSRTESLAPYFTITPADRCITVSTAGHSVLLGALSGPTAWASYEIRWSMRWPTLPTATTHADIIFGQTNDDAYNHQTTTNTGDGYHIAVRPNNTGSVLTMQCYSHVHGVASGTLIGSLADSTIAAAGGWLSFKVTVTPTTITLERTDIVTTPVVITNSEYRGPCIHACIGSSSNNVDFRDVSVVKL
jgi:glycerophosphoryl diester phosphodiesterase